MTFYQWVQQYPHEDAGRIALARHMKDLAKRHHEVKKISSYYDLVTVASYMTDRLAFKAVSEELWCEYCTATGRPLDLGG